MDDLLEALAILAKYGKPDRPFHCEHDELTLMWHPEGVSEADLARLDDLGISPNGDCFHSFRFGSA